MKSFYTPPHTSWTHLLTRVMVRPLVGTRVTPNHLTTGRLVSGILACAAFMVGDFTWDIFGGIMWIISCLLDRADGELARLGGTSSPGGHLYDYYCDIAVNGLFFFAIGVGLREGDFGLWAVVLGTVASITVVWASVLSEELEDTSEPGTKAYAGILGFDFDDILYLFAPAAWVGLFPYLLIGSAIGGPVFAALTWVRLRKQKATAAQS